MSTFACRPGTVAVTSKEQLFPLIFVFAQIRCLDRKCACLLSTHHLGVALSERMAFFDRGRNLEIKLASIFSTA